MAKLSIGGVTFEVSTGAEKAGKELTDLEGLRKKYSKLEEQRNKALLADTATLEKATNNLTKAEEKYAAALESGDQKKIKGAEINLAKARDKEAEATKKLTDRQAAFTRQTRATAESIVDAQKKTTIWSQSLSKASGVISGAMKAGLAALPVLLLKNINYLDDLNKRARDLGVSAGALRELEHLGKKAGIETSALGKSLEKFHTQIGAAGRGDAAPSKIFDRLGISVRDSNGDLKRSQDLLVELAAKYKGTGNNAELAKTAAELFGEEGKKLTRILSEGGDALKEAFNAQSIDAAAAAAEKFNDNLANSKKWAADKGISLLNGLVEQSENLGFWLAGVDKEQARAYMKMEEEQKRRRAEESAQRMALEKQTEENRQKREKADEAEAKARRSQMSDLDKIINLRGEVASLAEIMAENEEHTNEYTQAYITHSEKIVELEALQNKMKEERAKLDQENLKKIADANKRVEEAQKKELSLDDQILEANKEIAKARAQLDKTGRDGFGYADEYVKLADAEVKLAALMKQKTSADDAEAKKLKDKTDNILKAREEFEIQHKINVLKAQGKDKAAEAIENQIKVNSLMEKYGYTYDEAIKKAKELNALEKGDTAQYSDEAKKKAQKILDRAKDGKGGTAGKQTIAEAQAIVDGKEPEGGFKTAIFEGTKKQRPKEEFLLPKSSKDLASEGAAISPQALSGGGKKGVSDISKEEGQNKQKEKEDKGPEVLEKILNKFEEVGNIIETAFGGSGA